MNNNSSKDYQNSLITIYSYVSEKEFKKAEIELLKQIGVIIAAKSYKLSEAKKFIQLIYSEFNSHYYKWLTKSGARIRVSLSDLYTKEHNNYFIGNCFDPSAMDDLLYELMQCDDNEVGDDISHHYECYVARLKKRGKA